MGKRTGKGSDSKMEISNKHNGMRVPNFLGGNKFRLRGNQVLSSERSH